MNAGNTGTIKEAHIKASLLSAVEEKVMRRVAQLEAQYQDEMKVLHQTQMDLNNGKVKLEELMQRLEFEEVSAQCQHPHTEFVVNVLCYIMQGIVALVSRNPAIILSFIHLEWNFT